MARGKTRQVQAVLPFKQRGGARPGAGRKPKGRRAGVAHAARPALAARHPVHVTVRLRAGLPPLRKNGARRVLESAFAAGAERFGFRLAHYSIQTGHLHLIVEAQDARSLSRGVKGLLVRVARALNRHWGRKGAVVADRYHTHVLRSPREVRHALHYVMHNARHHGIQLAGVDPYSSGRWFDGWAWPMSAESKASPCAVPTTWLLRIGWRRHGLLEIDPRLARRTAA